MNSIRQPPSDLMTSLGDGRLVHFDVDSRCALMEFTAKHAMCHSGNIVQGGFVTGWLDSAMSHAAVRVADGVRSPATLEIKVNFFRAAHPGLVRAEGRVVRLGGSIAFLEGRLLDQSGEVIATASSTAKMVPLASVESAG